MTRRELERMLAEAGAGNRGLGRIAVLAAVAAAVSSVLLPGISGWFLTGAALAGAGGIAVARGFNYLVPSALIRTLAIVRTVSRYGERYAGHAAALRTLAGLRAGLFRRLLHTGDPRAVSAADSAARLAGDVDVLEERLVRRPSDAGAVAGAATGLLLASAAGAGAAFALLAVLAALVLATWRLAPRLLDRPALLAADAAGRLKQAFVEQLPASAEIAAFGLEGSTAAAMLPLARRLDAARHRLVRGEALLGAASVAAAGLAMAAVLLTGKGAAPLLVLAMLGAAGAVEALGGLLRGIARERAVTAALHRISALAQGDAGGGAVVRGDVLLLNGTEVRAGERVAIPGISGSGKTRLLETLAGIRPAHDATVAVDGVPVSAIDRESLRPLFAIAPQGADLLAATVRDNVAMARPGLSEEAMWEALETACLADEVRAMDGGLDRWLGDGGARLSGGQRKRLALARALAAGRPWLVLDEPTEGLDPELEARLVASLGRWLDRTGAGLLIASHRPAPLALCRREVRLG